MATAGVVDAGTEALWLMIGKAMQIVAIMIDNALAGLLMVGIGALIPGD